MTRTPRSRAHPATTAKVQRWIDLVAALLSRRTPATFEELAREVPEYWTKWQDALRERSPAHRRMRIQSLKRTFERDKDELRRLGVQLHTLPDEAGGQEAGTYAMRAHEFYLPYLCVAGTGVARTGPRRVDRYGYRALTTLSFTPDELQAVVDAAAVVGDVGDPMLHRDATSALRKLAADLPVDGVRRRDDELRVVLPRARAHAVTFEVLGDALRRRKTVAFSYAGPGGQTARRNVEPYGLFFVGSHWYLAAHDRARGARRNFRLNRISDASVNSARAGSADFEIPAEFDLRALARSRQAWELGEGEEERAVFEVRGNTGSDLAALQHGVAVEGWPARRVIQVRRRAPLIRWLLSFAGGVVPVEPPELVALYRDAVRGTRARYERAVTDVPAPSPAGNPTTPEGWRPATAAEQWQRILQAIPLLADGEPHAMARVAAALGTSVEVLREDLYSLASRFEVPGGFVEGVQVYLESERVSVVTNHFLRPMRLTMPELCTLELGLAMLRARRPPDEHTILQSARERLRAAMASLPGEADDWDARVQVAHPALGAHAQVLRRSIRERRKVSMSYRRATRSEASLRVVHPQGLVASHGALYVVAWCERSADLRVFRMDRIETATLLDERCEVDAPLDVEALISSGKVFRHDGAPSMRVWYAPIVAPWIAEREGRRIETDGSLVVEHPVADDEWAIRHVLQYGDGAEVLVPGGLRTMLKERLDRMLEAVGDG